jgi:hypothetical protein
MKEVMGFLALCLLGLTVLFGLGWLVQGNQFFMYKFFAPKQEAVRREVFEQSKAYNQGMQQELENMRFEYVKAAPDQQKMLASLILHRAADYDLAKMQPDMQTFIMSLKSTPSGGKY